MILIPVDGAAPQTLMGIRSSRFKVILFPNHFGQLCTKTQHCDAHVMLLHWRKPDKQTLVKYKMGVPHKASVNANGTNNNSSRRSDDDAR